MIDTGRERTMDNPFLSMREAELAVYPTWGPVNMTTRCDECSCMIMTGDMARIGDNGSICATCGKD